MHTQVLTQYAQAPGCCRFCEMSQRNGELILDTGRDIYDPEAGWDGRVYVCQTCLTDWGHLMGLITVAEAAGLREVLAQAQTRADELEAEIQALSEARSAVLAAAESIRQPELAEDPPPEVIDVELPEPAIPEAPVFDDDSPITVD